MNMPLISIIVPVYNVERYLQKSINSLLTQSYNNIEIILIDDGSTDHSGEICDRFAEKDSKVVAFHKRNTGLGLTRNYGLNRINGQYVAFVDSDDYVGKDFIEKLISPIINDNTLDTVVGGYTRISSNGKILFREKYLPHLFEENNIKNKLFLKMLGGLPNKSDSIKPSVWNCLFSVDLIRRYRLQFVSERKLISEDIVWDSDYFFRARKVKLIESSSYYYRSNPTSLSCKYNKNRLQKSIYFYNYMENKIKKLGLKAEASIRLKKYLFIMILACVSQLKTLSYNSGLKEAKKICNNDVLQVAIKNYPVNQLLFKQKKFIQLLKNKRYHVLVLLSKSKVI